MNVRSMIGMIGIGLIGIAFLVTSLVAYFEAQSFSVVGITEGTFTFYNDVYDGDTYIHVFEQEKPLVIPNYVHPNKSLLNELERQAIIIIGYIEDENGLHDKEVVYLYHNDEVILSYEDYVAGNQRKFYIGSVITLVIGLFCLVTSMIIWIFEPRFIFHSRMTKYEVDPTLEENYVPSVLGIERLDINLLNNRKQFKKMIKTIPEYTIRFYYLSEDLSNETAILFYRIGNQLIVSYLYYEEDHYILELLTEMIEFTYPMLTPLEPYEFEAFKNALEVYSLEMDIPIRIVHVN